MNWQPRHPAFQTLLKTILQHTSPVYIVGGVVRDMLLGKQEKITDLDLVVERAALPIARKVADKLGWAFYALDEGRDVARLVFTATGGAPLVCDVARMRGDTIEGDLLERDFTVNALALAYERLGEAHLIDICHGQEDLKKRLLRRVSGASLADDPVRMLRAMRFAVQLQFELEDQTLLQIKRMASTVTLTSPERIRDELWKILTTDAPTQALEAMQSVGLLSPVLPEIAALRGVEQSYPHYQDVYQHSLRVVEQAVRLRNWIDGKAQPTPEHMTQDWQTALAPWRPALQQHFAKPLAAERTRSEWLVWSALLHDIGKPATRTMEITPDGPVRYRFLDHERVGAEQAEARLDHLRFSRHEIGLVRTVVENHTRPHLLNAGFLGKKISARAAYRFFRDTGGRQMEWPLGIDTLLLALADFQGTYPEPPPQWAGYLQHVQELLAYAFAENGLRATQRQPLVDGHQLMTYLQLPPGPHIGRLLEQVLEAQAAGEIQTADEALALAARWLEPNNNSADPK